MAIDKDQSIGTQLAECNIAKLLLAKLLAKRINSWSKRQFGDRLDVGEPPILVSQSRVSRLGEPGQAGLAEGHHRRAVLLQLGKCLHRFNGGISSVNLAHAASLISQS